MQEEKKPARRETLLMLLLLIAGVVAIFSGTKTTGRNDHIALVQRICKKTLYPSTCHSTLSFPISTIVTTKRTVLDLALTTVNTAIKSIIHARLKIKRLRSLPRSPATKDCLLMLDQSLHILRASRTNLRSVFRVRNRRTRNLRQVRSLLAAAMTHRDSCLSGLDDENVFNSSRSGIKNKIVFSKFLNPMKETLSNALAITNKLLKFSERVIAHRRVSELGLGNPGPDEFVVVCSNGTGDYKTISEAVEAAPSSISHRFVIQISPGVYSENIFIPFQKNNLMFVGSGMNLTVIEGNRNMKDGYTTFNSATLAISGAGFLARDLTVVNTAGPAKGQAVALRVSADQAAFYRCNISGYQDTLYAHSSSQFYRDCIISGTVDFIFGNAAAVFQNCLIIVLHPLQGQRDMITAHSRDDPFQPTGFSLQNCSITAPIYNHFSSNTSK